jgi:hypothetical protein
LKQYGKLDISVTRARKHKIWEGFSKYSLCMNMFCRNSGLFKVQKKNWDCINLTSHGGLLEIWNIWSTENNKIWSVGENGV